MEARIRRWGNSLAVRVPAILAAEASLCDGAAVNLTIERGRLIVTPIEGELDLRDLMSTITEQNIHAETTWGGPVGREAW